MSIQSPVYFHSDLERGQHTNFRRMFTSCILATDMGEHASHLVNLKEQSRKIKVNGPHGNPES